MPLTPTKRAALAIAIILCLCAAGIVAYLHYSHVHPAGFAASAELSPDLLSELPPNAPVIAYVDLSAIRDWPNSPLPSLLPSASSPQSDPDYQQFVEETGFDYTRDLDRAALAFWPASLDASLGGVASDRTLAIADGRFDAGKIRSYALRRGGKTIGRGSQNIVAVPGEPPVAYEFLSPTRIAIASGPAPADLLGTPSATTRDPALQARMSRVAGAPIFAVAKTDNLPNGFYSALRNSNQLDKLARSIRGITLAGKPDGGNFDVTLDAESDSIKDAFEIATLLSGARIFGSMAISDPKNRSQMTAEQAALLTAAINRTKINHDNNWVRMSLTITPEMLNLANPSTNAKPSIRRR